MESDKRPITSVEEFFENLRGSIILTTLDFSENCRQIKMDETFKMVATSICMSGMYQFEVMPFRLKNLSETFQKMVDNILVNMSNVKCYGDDAAIHSSTQ